jgi:hypothetical protein
VEWRGSEAGERCSRLGRRCGGRRTSLRPRLKNRSVRFVRLRLEEVKGRGYVETDAEEGEDSEHKIAAVLLEFVDLGFVVDEGF